MKCYPQWMRDRVRLAGRDAAMVSRTNPDPLPEGAVLKGEWDRGFEEGFKLRMEMRRKKADAEKREL